MPMPRARFTVRKLMKWVAVAACVLWGVILMERSQRYGRISTNYAMAKFLWYGVTCSPLSTNKAKWVEDMQKKYEYAAAHPWLPVEPDPPEPEL
jgi:hypothetical protein